MRVKSESIIETLEKTRNNDSWLEKAVSLRGFPAIPEKRAGSFQPH
jgi:hypothetical protein